MDVVAIVALGRSVEEEAPALAADLGLTIYETSVMLRAPAPVIVLRSDDRAQTLDLLGKLRGRRHEAIACDTTQIVSSDLMFTPKSFRFEGDEMIGIAGGEERRLSLSQLFAIVRATHVTSTEDIKTTTHSKVSLTSAALTGGLKATKTTTVESKSVVEEREPVAYLFRSDTPPWLVRSQLVRYDGLGDWMRPSKTENFGVLLALLRELAPSAEFDERLLANRALATKIMAPSAKHMSSSSTGTVDILAYIVAAALGRAARPYR